VIVQLACLKWSCFSRVLIVWKVRTLSVKKTLDHSKCLSCGEAWNNMKHGNVFHKPKVKWGNVSRTSSKLVGYIESWTLTQTMKKHVVVNLLAKNEVVFQELRLFEKLKTFKCQEDSWPLKSATSKDKSCSIEKLDMVVNFFENYETPKSTCLQRKEASYTTFDCPLESLLQTKYHIIVLYFINTIES
jgi:hypothetical protein